MVRLLMGMNRTFTLRRSVRSITDSGSASEETITTIATGIPGSIQPHVLSNLPPPPERTKIGGLVRVDEFRLWFGDPVASAEVRQNDLITEEGTDPLRTYRVLAILDEAGRGHHQYMRVESYSQASQEWATVGEPSV